MSQPQEDTLKDKILGLDKTYPKIFELLMLNVSKQTKWHEKQAKIGNRDLKVNPREIPSKTKFQVLMNPI